MKEVTLRILKRVTAIILLIIGVAGLLIPIIPGWLLIGVGLVMAGIVDKEDIKVFVKKLRKKLRRR